MHIEQLEVKNYRAIRDMSLSLKDTLGRVRPVTVIAGPNGCGKTSLLFAIVQCLRLAMRYRTDDVPEPTDLDIYGAGQLRGWSPEPLQIRIKLDLLFHQSELDAIGEVLRQTGDQEEGESQSVSPDGRASVEWVFPPGQFTNGRPKPPNRLERWEPREAVQWLGGRARAIQARQRLSDRSLLDKIGGLLLFPQDRSLWDRVIGEMGGVLSDDASDRDTADDDDTEGNRRTRLRSPQPIWGVLRYLSDYARDFRERGEPLDDERNWEKRIQDQFARICSPKRYVGFQYRDDFPMGAPCFQEGENTYPAHTAASGEHVIIEYLTRLNYPSPLNSSVILVDEPEMHLHPAWIRRLYRALPGIGENNQYILTTHSPELRTMAAQDDALVDLGELEAQ